MRGEAQPRGPTPEEFERIGGRAAPRLSRREAEMLLGERLRVDVAEYAIARPGRTLRVQYFAGTPMTRPFWVIWLPDGSRIQVSRRGRRRDASVSRLEMVLTLLASQSAS